jgi:uncharacterized protein (TIGR02145 family)
MKKTITLILLAFMAVCLTNAQDIMRSIKTNDWEETLKKDVTYTIEPFGDKVALKEGDDYLHFLTLPETLIFDSKELEGVLINGVKWATRNLASQGTFVEKQEDYGTLFQWGRKGDGHENRTSVTIAGPISTLDANGQVTGAAIGKFITNSTDPYDWRSPQLNTLWNSGTETAPVKTANDPCPTGWRLPTQTEQQSLLAAGSEWDNLNGGRVFGTAPNQIFLPAAGYRLRGDGGVYDTDRLGFYWSSSVYDVGAHVLPFNDEDVNMGHDDRACGFSVRCVAEL